MSFTCYITKYIKETEPELWKVPKNLEVTLRINHIPITSQKCVVGLQQYVGGCFYLPRCVLAQLLSRLFDT